jgi:hypothetical protein
MNTENIKLLIEKYFEGETTIAEEQALKSYFASENVAEELRQHTPLFRFVIEESKVKAPQSLNQKLTGIFFAEPFYRSRIFIFYTTSIAAGLLLLLAFFLTIKNEPDAPSQQLTETQRREVKLAYNQTRATLAFVSQNLIKGTAPLEKIEKLEAGHTALQQLGRLDDELNQISANMNPFTSQIENLNQLSKFNIFTNN